MGGSRSPGPLGTDSPGPASPRGATSAPRVAGADHPSRASVHTGAAGGAVSGAAGAAHGSSSRHAARLCPEGRVRIIPAVGRTPRAETARNAAWLRRQDPPEDDRLGLTTFDVGAGLRAYSHPGRPFEVYFNLRFPHMYIAHEMVRNRAALDRMKTHELGHVRTWTDTFDTFVSALCARLEPLVPSLPTNQVDLEAIFGALDDEVARARDELNTELDDTAHAWDDTDYPDLHSDLDEAGFEAP